MTSNLPMVFKSTAVSTVGAFESEEDSVDQTKTVEELAAKQKELASTLERIKNNVADSLSFYRKSDEFVDLENQIGLTFELLLAKQATLEDEIHDDRIPEKPEFDHEALPDAETDKFESEPMPESETPEQKTTKRQKQLAKQLSKVYKSIMLLIHPDRTKSKELHDLIPIVEKLMAESNLGGLQELLNHIKDSRSAFKYKRERSRKELSDLIFSYQESIRKLEEELTAVTQDLSFVLHQIHMQHMPMTAVHIANNMMKQQLKSLKHQLEMLSRPKDQVYTHNGGFMPPEPKPSGPEFDFDDDDDGFFNFR